MTLFNVNITDSARACTRSMWISLCGRMPFEFMYCFYSVLAVYCICCLSLLYLLCLFCSFCNLCLLLFLHVKIDSTDDCMYV